MHGDPLVAVGFVSARATQDEPHDRARLHAALGEQLSDSLIDGLIAGIRTTRLTLNFHPDRLGANRTSVAHGLLTSGQYLPQSQTGVSNGMRYAVHGGARTAWEHELFGGVYGTAETGRPVYGALDVGTDPFGGSPRFGSCYVVLKPHCLHRATLCVGDSHVGATDVGTYENPISILAGLFEQATYGNALNRGLSIDQLVHAIGSTDTAAAPARELDSYVEAQVHGGVSMQDDVAKIVLDPSFTGTAVHDDVAQAAREFGFTLDWHRGSILAASDVPLDFRGPEMGPLATRIAGERGVLNAAAIGRSAASIAFTPPAVGGDPTDGPLQHHKQLWHCLLRFGYPA